MAGGALGPGQAIAALARGQVRARARIHIPAHMRSKPSSAAFPCAGYCTGCGYMVLPDEAGGSGDPGPCPACRSNDWANLGDGGVVDALVSIDDERRDLRDAGQGSLVLLAGGSVLTAMGLMSPVSLVIAVIEDGGFASEDLLGGLVGIVFYLSIGFVFLMVGSGLLRRGLRNLRAGARPDFPTRWSYARVRAGLFASSRAGRAGGTPTLVAPFSGKSCLGYVLGVRPDDLDMDQPWSWSVLEQRVAPMDVDGTPLAEPVFVRATPDLFERPRSPEPRAAEVDRALQIRGIDPERPGYSLYESVILPEQEVEVRHGARGSVLGLRS